MSLWLDLEDDELALLEGKVAAYNAAVAAWAEEPSDFFPVVAPAPHKGPDKDALRADVFYDCAMRHNMKVAKTFFVDVPCPLCHRDDTGGPYTCDSCGLEVCKDCHAVTNNDIPTQWSPHRRRVLCKPCIEEIQAEAVVSGLAQQGLKAREYAADGVSLTYKADFQDFQTKAKAGIRK
jgi:hypothetical protein